MAAVNADRDLLFGMLALQNGLVDQGQLVAAFQSWTRDRARPLAEHLAARGDLDPDQRAGVEAMVGLHLRKHRGDPAKSLASIPAGRSTRESLAALGDPAIEHSLTQLASGSDGEADRTASYAVGTATTDGQRFRVLRPHARGGLGAVFVALDTELHRDVALKQILDSHADDPVSRQRFLLEAEVTGGLEHPGIVPVYGLGAHVDGRPYYAMRFIRGDSLKEAIDRFQKDDTLKSKPGHRSLELRKLLRRFTDVCNAIDYAHSRGVLHRDIKPGNVIVGKHGETLVVDWGLAKATGKADPAGGEHTLVPSSASCSAETLPGSALGTPAYMSPEQARGEIDNLGPRSDVYSLGATLYCLLTGGAPFVGDDIGQVLRKAQRGEFTPPRQVTASIDKTLEAICLKAMALVPDARYASPRALADDIERWMADEPVTAWREPWTRTAARWLSRHRTLVASLAASVLVALAGTAAVLVVQTQANAQLMRSRADVQARYELAVEAIKTFHTGVSEDFLLKQDQFQALRDRLLKSASEFYGKLSALLDKETDLTSRRALAESKFELANLTALVGRGEDALAAHRSVLAERERLAAEHGAGRALLSDVGRSLNEVARRLEATGKNDEAIAVYRRSESLLAGQSAAEPSIRAALAGCRMSMGALLSRLGKSDEALDAYRKAQAEQETLAASPNASLDARCDLATTVYHIGVLLARTGKPKEAEHEYRTALTMCEKLAAANPAIADFQSRVAALHFSLGILFWQTGRLSDAEAEYHASLLGCEKLVAENRAVIDFRNRLANSHSTLGQVLAQTGRPTDAEAQYQAAFKIFERLVEDNPSLTDFRRGLADCHINLGILLSETGRLSDAGTQYRRALVIDQKLVDENPEVTEFRTSLAHIHNNFANVLMQTGHPALAEGAYRQAILIQENLVSDHPEVTDFGRGLAYSYNNLGELMARRGRNAQSESIFRKALPMLQSLVDGDPANYEARSLVADTQNSLGVILARAGKSSEAEASYQNALGLRRELARVEPGNPMWPWGVGSTLTNLSALDADRGHLDAAIAKFRESTSIHDRLVRAHPTVTDYQTELTFGLIWLGRALYRLGQGNEAIEPLQRAITLHVSSASLSPEVRYDLACAHALLAAAGRSAAELEKAAAALRLAVSDGYTDLARLKVDPDLESLRRRAEFRLLLLDLAMPSDPFAAARRGAQYRRRLGCAVDRQNLSRPTPAGAYSGAGRPHTFIAS